MTTGPRDALALPDPPAETEDRRAASAALCAALRLIGVHPILEIGTLGTPAVTVTIQQDGTGTFLLPGAAGLARDAAATLRQALLQWNVKATVSTRDLVGAPALVLALASAADAQRLASLVKENLPEPHAAAHRLHEALHVAGIHADDLRATPEGLVSIGDITAEMAAALCRVLSGRSCEDLDLESWQDLEQLADRLAIDLQSLLSTPVDAVANPVCAQCQYTSTHQVTLGTLTPERARRLATTVESTTHQC